MTDGYISINGKRPLSGEITVHGSKNSALPCLCACTLCEKGCCNIRGCPLLSDVNNTIEIMETLGCKCDTSGGEQSGIGIDAEPLFGNMIDADMMNRMRSSILFLGTLLSRTGEVTVGYPGGCELGARPIDLHLKAFRKLGVRIEEGCGAINCKIKTKLTPTSISLLCPSVGATENIMLLMAKSDGETIIRNAAREPEIVDLQNLLNQMGANIKGAGTDVIAINGVKELRGTDFKIMADRIVALTYMSAVAGCGGKISLHGVNPEYLAICNSVLRDMGAEVMCRHDGITILMEQRPKAVNTIKTLYYPGFPTDAQPQFMSAMTVAKGTTVFLESIFENRFRHAQELNKLGADIDINMCHATVRGREFLSGTEVKSFDLRGGAAMVVAGLIAEGTTKVYGLSHIERGYKDIAHDFSCLGADISVVY